MACPQRLPRGNLLFISLSRWYKIKEQWKNINIEHFEHFEVSNTGKIRNSKTGKEISQWDNGKGYKVCTLKARPYEKKVYVHREVARAFLKNFREDLEVNHIDKNKSHNYLSNLEMMTIIENRKYSKPESIIGHIKAQGRTVCLYNLDGELFLECTGIYEMCREYKFNVSMVYKALKEGKTYKGYKFKYKE